jgi:hypothetical protein
MGTGLSNIVEKQLTISNTLVPRPVPKLKTSNNLLDVKQKSAAFMCPRERSLMCK